MTSVPSVAQAVDPHSYLADLLTAQYSNPAFDPRRYSTNPWYAGIEQGLLIRNGLGESGGTLGKAAKASAAKNAQGGSIPNSVKLRFLYNPSDFNENMTPSDTLFPNIAGQGSTDPNDTASLVGQTTTTCSFNLLFDRTYEVNDAYNQPGNPAQFSHKTGVYVDILAFKALLGIPLNGNGMALYLPVHLYLGGVHSPSFYGVIMSASIAYSHFSVNMVPLRAAISISMTQWLDDTNGSGSGPPITDQLTDQTAGKPQVLPRTGTVVPGIIGGIGLNQDTPTSLGDLLNPLRN